MPVRLPGMVAVSLIARVAAGLITVRMVAVGSVAIALATATGLRRTRASVLPLRITAAVTRAATAATVSATAVTAAPVAISTAPIAAATITSSTATATSATTVAPLPLTPRRPILPTRTGRRHADRILRQRSNRYRAPQHPLDVAQQRTLIRSNQRHGKAGAAGTRRTAYAMHIVLRHVRQFVVHDMRQLFDVEPTRGNLGRHERHDLVVLEISQCAHARTLALVAMNRGGADAVGFQLLREPVGSMFGTREHEYLVPVTAVDQMRKQVPLVILRDAIDGLLHPVGGSITRSDLDGHRIAHEALRELADLFRVSRREHEVLTLRGQKLENAANGVDEAHIQHAIGFVENEILHSTQIHGALLGKIQQPARSGDQEIAAGTHRMYLRANADTAKDHGGAQADVLAVVAGAFRHLGGQLTRRGQDQRARRTDDRRLGFGEPLQHGQHERRRLTSTGLRASDEIAAREHGRNRLGLNGTGRSVAFFGYGTQKLGLEPEKLE